MPIPAAAFIGATLGASALQGIGNWFSTQSSNNAQREMFNRSMDFQKYMYEDQKNYNGMPAQVSRMKQAGINPSLGIAGGANAGSVSSGSAPAVPDQKAFRMPDLSTALNNALQYDIQRRQSDADINLKDQQGALLSSQTENQNIRNMYERHNQIMDLYKKRAELRKIDADSDYVNKMEQFYDNEIKRQTTELQYLQEKLEWQNEGIKQDTMLKVEQQKTERMVQELDRVNAYVAQLVGKKQADMLSKQIDYLVVQADQLEKNGVTERTLKRKIREQVAKSIEKLDIDSKIAQNALDAYIDWLDPWLDRVGKVSGLAASYLGARAGAAMKATPSSGMPGFSVPSAGAPIYGGY